MADESHTGVPFSDGDSSNLNSKRACVFCKIISGEISQEPIVESDNFIVIADKNPRTEGHSLVIPKKHYETFLDMPAELYSEFMETTKKAVVKLLDSTGAEGYNLVMNNGKVAGQIVLHVHLHIIPRTKGDNYLRI